MHLANRARTQGKPVTGTAKILCTYADVRLCRCLLVKQKQPKLYILGSSYGIRLVNTGDASRGRVEIYHPSYGWGTVCDDAFDITDGSVICRQLGYSAASSVYQSAHYGQGTGLILLDDLKCSGSESFIWDCPHLGWTKHNCGHGEDSSVDCY